MINNLKPCAKAIIAAIGGGLTVAATFVAPGSTWGHVIAIALGALTVAGVYAVPNARPLDAAVAALKAAQAKRQAAP